MNNLFKVLLLKAILLCFCNNAYSVESIKNNIQNSIKENQKLINKNNSILKENEYNSNLDENNNNLASNINKYNKNDSSNNESIYEELSLKELCYKTKLDKEFNQIYKRMTDKREALENFLENINICNGYLSKLKKSGDDSYNNEVKTLNINVDIELNEYFSNLLKYNKNKISIIDFLRKISKTVESLYKSLSEDNFDENANTFNEIITQLLDVFNNIKKNSSVYSHLFKTNNKEFQKKIKIQIGDHVQKGPHGTIIDEITVLNEALSILLSISKDTCTVRELTKKIMNDLESYISSISSSICNTKYEINAKEKPLIIVARNKTFYYCSIGTMFDCDPLDKQFKDYQKELNTLIDNCTQKKIKLNINKDDYKSISKNKLNELHKNYNWKNGYYDTSDKLLLITIDKPINVKKYISELITKNKQRLRLGDQLKIEDNYKDAIDKFV